MSALPEQIIQYDANDPLASKRQLFDLPANTIYLDGNSLGPLPVAAKERLKAGVEEEWAVGLIRSWNEYDWINLPTQVGEKIAPLLGAQPGQVVCCDSISVNLFKLLVAAITLNQTRTTVLTQTDNFPTDVYIVEGLRHTLGARKINLAKVPEAQLAEALTDDIAVLLLTQVNFRSGLMHNIEQLTARAHEVGALVICDLAHSAGVVPLQLDAWGVDFAVGCGYKYLNGGPGAPAFIYVAERHLASTRQPISGWMGHKKPFDFAPEFSAAPGIEHFLSGTPPVLSMLALDAALELYQGVDIDAIRKKSEALTNLFMRLIEERAVLNELTCLTPLASDQRGSHVAYSHPQGYGIAQCLIERNVIVDFRSPDIVRFGFSPLFNSFADVWNAVTRLEQVIHSGDYLNPKYKSRAKVT